MPDRLPSAYRLPSLHSLARPITGRVFISLLLCWLAFFAPAPVSAQVPSGAGNALYFDGVDDSVQVADHPSLDFGSGNFSVELWVQRLNAGVRTDLLERNNGAGTALAIYIGADNRVYFETYQNGLKSALASTATVGAGWTHIACVRQYTSMTVYINGRRDATTALTRRNFDSDSPIRLGQGLRGALDEVRIWRSARTHAEILENMYRSLAPATGMVAVFPFDQSDSEATLTDISANGNHGQLAGFSFDLTPWRPSGAFSGPKQALSFDGSNDYVSIFHSDQLHPVEYTIEVWINRDTTHDAVGTILRKGEQEPYQLTLDALNAKVIFGLWNGSARHTITSQSNIVASRWYHLAATYQAADGGTMKLYVNGVLEGTLTGVGVPVANTRPLTLGGGTYTGMGSYRGKMDEVRIWSRARTAAEIRNSMARTLSGSEADLVVYYRFDQALDTQLEPLSSQSLFDLGPNHLNGLLYAFPVAETIWQPSAAFNTWLGAESSDWSEAANWSAGAGPAGSGAAGILAGSFFAPTVSDNALVDHLVIGSGATLTASGSPTLMVDGNWINQGDFVPGSSTVTLTGENQHLVGSTSFYNLAKTILFPETLTFPAGETQTIGNTLTLKGSGGQLLALRSSQPGVQWGIDPQGERDLASLDVQDSNNVNETVIQVGAANILDSGNNTGWGFGSPPAITEGESVSVTMSEDGAPIPFQLTLHATDPDGDTLTWSLDTLPSHGAAVAAGTGGQLEVSYEPNAGYSGTDSFVVTVSDNKHGSDSITVNVTVQAVNDSPIFTGGTELGLDEDGFHDLDLEPLFTDPEGDPIVFAVKTGPANGSAVITGTTLTYTPESNFNGGDSLAITASDGQGGTVDVTFHYTINPVNDAPALSVDEPIRVAMAEDGTYVNELGDFVSDVDGDPLTYTVTDPAGHGVAEIAGSSLTYTPAANYHGGDSFQVTADDGEGGVLVATFDITITAVNDPPTFSGANPVLVGLDEDGSYVSANLLPLFGDVDGDPLSFTITTGPAQGRAELSTAVIADGLVLVYEPNTDFHGSDSLTITAADDENASLEVVVKFTVAAVNDAPASADITVTTQEDTPCIFSAADFPFTDVDEGDTLHSVTLRSLPAVGVLTLNGAAVSPGDSISAADLDAGRLAFQPAANAYGSPYAAFDFRVSDGVDSSGDYTLTIDVAPINDAPVFSGSSSIVLPEDGSASADLALLFSDVDGDLLAFDIMTAPTKGSAVITGTTLTYTPNANYNGTDSLTVRVADGQGEMLDVAFDLIITAVNDAPDSANGAATIAEDTLHSFSAADFYFSDIDGDVLHSVEIRSLPGAGMLFLDANTNDTPDDGESVSINQAILAANLTLLKFRPAVNATGAPYTEFDFRVSDGAAFSSDRSFAISVTAVNDAPVFSGGSPYAATLIEDNPYSVNLSALFTDADGDVLSFEITTNPASGSAGLSEDGVTGDQILTYQPDANANGSDSLTVTASDGQGGSLSVVFALTIIPVNDAPATQNRSVSIEEDAQYAFSPADFSFTDVDGDALHAVRVLSISGSGVFFLDANANGAEDAGEGVSSNQVIAAADLSHLIFQPAANASGSAYAGLTFRVSDGQVYSPDAAFSIDVTAVNDAPQINCAGACALSGSEDADLVLTGLSVADVDAGAEALTITLAVQHGTLSAPLGLPGGTVIGSGTRTLTLTGPLEALNAAFAGGGVHYRGDLHFNGSDTLTAVVNDNGASGAGGALTDDESIPLTITAVNDPPDSADNTVVTAEDTLYVFSPADFPFTDVESEALHAVQIRSLPGAGVLFLDADGDGIADAGEAAAVDALIPAGELGGLKFHPAENAYGAAYAAFDFRVSDGTDTSGDYTLTVDVTSVNDAPVFSGLAAMSLLEDQSASTNLAAMFSDADGDSLSYAVLSGPVHGAADLNEAILTVTPAANYHGSDSLTVRVVDGQGGMVDVVFDLTVTSVNDVPTAADGNLTLSEDGLHVFSAADFSFADIDGDALHAVEILSLPEAGTLFLDADDSGAPGAGEAVTASQVIVAADLDAGRLVFLPAADAHGSPYAVFTFRVGDGELWSDSPNTLTVHVDSVNDAPVIGGTPASSVAAESPYSFLPTASDTDGDPLTFSIANKPAWASFDPVTGALTGTPSNAHTGVTAGIAITVSDGQGGSASLPAFDLTVTFTNHPPVAAGVIPAQTAVVGEAFAYTVPLSFFTDPDAQDLAFTAGLQDGAALPDWLTFDAASRTFSGIPGLDDAGTLFLTVTAADPYGAQAALNFSLTVESPYNRPPLLAQPVQDRFVTAGIPFTFTVPAGTFYDPDGNPLTYHAQLANGQRLPDWLALDADTFRGTPPETGVWTLLLTASDGQGGAVSTTFDLTVTAEDLPPYLQVLIPDVVATAGSPFTFTLDPLTFVDPNGNLFTLQAELANGSPLPDWLHFDPQTLTFSGTPPAGLSGVLLVRVFVLEPQAEDLVRANQAGSEPAGDWFLIAISGGESTYLPADITGAQAALGQVQVTLPAGRLPAHPHYALKIETGVEVPPAPAGWVSLERGLRVMVVDANENPVMSAGSASICFALSQGDWVLGNGEARSFAAASAALAASAWRWLETVTDAGRRTACVDAPFGLVDLFIPVRPETTLAAELPATGFAPGRLTPLPAQSNVQAYTELGSLWLEIPRLGVQAEIVGVPVNSENAWDVTWLGARAGWLESTAFPTWAGNSLLAAHATTPDGRPGPFARLGDLHYGDRIIVHLFGQRYVYEVRAVDLATDPHDTRALRHEELPWLTLVTCREYDETRGEYRWRTVVRAVQVRIEE